MATKQKEGYGKSWCEEQHHVLSQLGIDTERGEPASKDREGKDQDL
jgi:hypothetical protein